MTQVASADISKLATALRTSGKESDATTHQVLMDAANYILSEMEVNVPVDSGNLRRSLGIRVKSDRIEIGPDAKVAPYAGYVEFGTAPHTIRPKAGKTLRFTVDGKVVYARVVNHPGTKPQPFVQPAFEKWVESLGEMAAEANIKVIAREAA